MKESLINKLNKLKNYFLIKENLNKNFKNIYLKIAELIFLKKNFNKKTFDYWIGWRTRIRKNNIRSVFKINFREQV